MTTASEANNSQWGGSVRQRYALHRRRTQLYVEPSSQRVLIRHFMLLIVFGAAAGVGTMSLLESLAEIYVWYDNASGSDAWVSRGMVLLYQFAFVATIALVAFLLALGFSHRVGGPATKISGFLTRMGEGDLRVVVRLRDGDMLKDLATTVNEAAAGLRTSVDEIKAVATEIEEMHGGGEDISAKLNQLNALLDGLQTRPNR